LLAARGLDAGGACLRKRRAPFLSRSKCSSTPPTIRASGQASQPLALVINAAKDKDVRGITEALDELHFERIFVAPVSSSRIHDPQEFVAHSVWTPDRVETSAELLSAFDGALDAVSRGGMVLVMGSIYLLGELIVALGCDDALQSIFSGGDVDEV